MMARREIIRDQAERPRYAIPPLCWAIDAVALEAWVASSEPGDRLTYAGGPVLPKQMEAVRRVRELIDEGEVRAHQHKIDGAWEYFIVRRVPPMVGAAPVPAPAAEQDDSPEARVFRAVNRRARLGLVMATDNELARECGLTGADQASYALRKLRDPRAGARRIRIENFGPRERRVATIVATGATTRRAPL